MRRNATIMMVLLALVGVMSIVAMIVVANRPNPDGEGANGDVSVADVPADVVTYDINVGGMDVMVSPRQSEELALVVQPAAPAPVAESEPVVVQEEPTAVPVEPTVQTVVVTEPPPPTAVPTAVPDPIQPTAVPPQQPASGGAQINTAVEPYTTVAHTVVSGDTLFSLSQRYATSIELMARRGIAADDLIINEVLQIPVANPAYCVNSTPYVVHERETVYSIGVRFGATPQAIRDVNRLGENYAIDVTQVLCIP